MRPHPAIRFRAAGRTMDGADRRSFGARGPIRPPALSAPFRPGLYEPSGLPRQMLVTGDRQYSPKSGIGSKPQRL